MNRRIKKKIKKRGNIFKYKNYKPIRRLVDKLLNIPICTFDEFKDWVDMGKKFEDLYL